MEPLKSLYIRGKTSVSTKLALLTTAMVAMMAKPALAQESFDGYGCDTQFLEAFMPTLNLVVENVRGLAVPLAVAVVIILSVLIIVLASTNRVSGLFKTIGIVIAAIILLTVGTAIVLMFGEGIC